MNNMMTLFIDMTDTNVSQLRKIFGPSNEFIKSLNRKIKSNIIKDEARCSSALLQESQCLASLSYENDTQWGKEARTTSKNKHNFLLQTNIEALFILWP